MTLLGRIGRFWRTLGPGLITGAADDDPSGIATYSLAGAQFGTGLLWMPLLAWPAIADRCPWTGGIPAHARR